MMRACARMTIAAGMAYGQHPEQLRPGRGVEAAQRHGEDEPGVRRVVDHQVRRDRRGQRRYRDAGEDQRRHRHGVADRARRRRRPRPRQSRRRTRPAAAALRPCHDTDAPETTTIVAPSAAPVATPIRYGSASGLRKTPWYVAPVSASVAPTSAGQQHARQPHVPDDVSATPPRRRCRAAEAEVREQDAHGVVQADAGRPEREAEERRRRAAAAPPSSQPRPEAAAHAPRAAHPADADESVEAARRGGVRSMRRSG